LSSDGATGTKETKRELASDPGPERYRLLVCLPVEVHLSRVTSAVGSAIAPASAQSRVQAPCHKCQLQISLFRAHRYGRGIVARIFKAPCWEHSPGPGSAIVGIGATNARFAQPRAGSAVVRIDEDDAGLFERALYCFDGAWSRTVPALKTLYRVIRHFGRAGEARHVPAESGPREEALNPKNWSHQKRDPAPSSRATVPFTTKAARYDEGRGPLTTFNAGVIRQLSG